MSHPVTLPLADGTTVVVPRDRILAAEHLVEQGAGFCYVHLRPVSEPLVVALPVSEVRDRMTSPYIRAIAVGYLLVIVTLSIWLLTYAVDIWLFW